MDQDAEESKMRVNAGAIMSYYQRYICYDNFVKTPPKCPTNRLCCFNMRMDGMYCIRAIAHMPSQLEGAELTMNYEAEALKRNISGDLTLG